MKSNDNGDAKEIKACMPGTKDEITFTVTSDDTKQVAYTFSCYDDAIKFIEWAKEIIVDFDFQSALQEGINTALYEENKLSSYFFDIDKSHSDLLIKKLNANAILQLDPQFSLHGKSGKQNGAKEKSDIAKENKFPKKH